LYCIKLKGSQPGGAEASGSDAEILHALLPPKEWVQDGQTWIQKVFAKLIVKSNLKKPNFVEWSLDIVLF
jgi:hypothetical protein